MSSAPLPALWLASGHLPSFSQSLTGPPCPSAGSLPETGVEQWGLGLFVSHLRCAPLHLEAQLSQGVLALSALCPGDCTLATSFSFPG